MSDYLQTARVKQIGEAKNITNDQEIVRYIVSDLRALLEKEREIHAQASDVRDIGTYHLLEDYIALQEKHIWMLNSWLNKLTINLDGEVASTNEQARTGSFNA